MNGWITFSIVILGIVILIAVVELVLLVVTFFKHFFKKEQVVGKKSMTLKQGKHVK